MLLFGSMDTLSDDERAELVRLVREAIAASRYPLSRRTLAHKCILAKLTGEDAEPKPPAPIRPTLGKKRHVFRG